MAAADAMAWEDLDGRSGVGRADADMAAAVLTDASDRQPQRMAAEDWLVRNSSPAPALMAEGRADARRYASGKGHSAVAPWHVAEQSEAAAAAVEVAGS